jgi:hypothetical protein
LPAATLLTVVFLVENPALRESVKKRQGFVNDMKENLCLGLPVVLQTLKMSLPHHLMVSPWHTMTR